MFKTTQEIPKFMKKSKGFKAVNTFIDELDRFYIELNGKEHTIRREHYEYIKHYPHKTKLVGEDICEMYF